MLIYSLIITAGVAVTVAIWTVISGPNIIGRDVPEDVKMIINGVPIQVSVADEPYEQQRGLSGRTSLKDGRGMLFIYAEPGNYNFWMKDMHFPLDFIWLNEGRIVGITTNVTPSAYPQAFGPPEPVRYILEVNAGWAAAHNLRPGQPFYLETLR